MLSWRRLLDTPLLRAMGFLVSQHGQLGAIPPPPFLSVSPLESMQSGGAIPPLKRGISAILARYPMKTGQMGVIPPLRYYLERVLRDMGGISHWAAKHAHKNKIGTSTPLLKNPNTPPKRRIFMGMGVFSSRKESKKRPGAHKISAAISGPRIVGGNFMDITLFLILGRGIATVLGLQNPVLPSPYPVLPFSYPALPFLGFSVLPRKALKLTKDFFPAEPTKTLETPEKHTHTQITKEIPCLN